MATVTLSLKKDREFALMRGHPWVYREALRELPPDAVTGDEAIILSHKTLPLGRGYLDLDSPILVRMIEGGSEDDLPTRIRKRLQAAQALRRSFFDPAQTDAYRLINGEGDGIPGLIIDIYGNAAAVQIYSLGLEPFVNVIASTLPKIIPGLRWIWRRNHVKRASGPAAALMFGKDMPEKLRFRENGLKFQTDLMSGQKTGFFLDQRDNRALIRQVARGRKAANVCGYTGAFTVAALAGGATRVVTVDSAKPALIEAADNLKINGYDPAKNPLIAADMYDFLESDRSETFDLLVVDPPSMARNRADLERAVRAYVKLNTLAINRVSPGGLLFTASCTSQLGRDEFTSAVTEACRRAGRRARIIRESFHALDHPIALSHPEGRYLKGLLLEIA